MRSGLQVHQLDSKEGKKTPIVFGVLRTALRTHNARRVPPFGEVPDNEKAEKSLQGSTEYDEKQESQNATQEKETQNRLTGEPQHREKSNREKHTGTAYVTPYASSLYACLNETFMLPMKVLSLTW